MTVKNNADNAYDLDILEEIENNPELTQATLATRMNVAIGTVNWHLKRLVEKGYVKIQHCEKRKLKYIITPEGLALRTKLTLDYIHSSFELYRLIRSRMNKVLDQCADQSYGSVYIDGDGDVGEICRLTGLERNFKILKRPDEQFPTIKVVGLKLFYNSPEGVEDPVTDMNDNQVPEQE